VTVTAGARLLALETATLEVGAAVLGDGRILAASASRPGRLHAETLHPAIEKVLSETDTPPRALSAVAVDVGPGLFTGLRVGVAAAKAFALALSIPTVAVRSTEALREMGERALGAGVRVVPVVDMRRGELAWESQDGTLEIGTAEKLASRLSRTGRVVIVGDGVRRLGEKFEDSETVSVVDDAALMAPSVEAIARIGIERLVHGVVEDAVSIAPVYLREADAVAHFETRIESSGARR
jgi:tRNA threonylcarbamoyladenosine biosynthesis protein TsaB